MVCDISTANDSLLSWSRNFLFMKTKGHHRISKLDPTRGQFNPVHTLLLMIISIKLLFMTVMQYSKTHNHKLHSTKLIHKN
jgi:hypothetical protein